MIFGPLADFVVDRGLARKVQKGEILDAAGRAAEAGLVHLADNTVHPSFLCSCCACCCGGLRTITEFNLPSVVANSRFQARVDESKCIDCGKCVRRCPSGALSLYGKKLMFKEWKCIGCGVCVPTCTKTSALRLVERPCYQPPHESYSHYLVDMGLQSVGLKKIVAERFPGAYEKLKGTLVQGLNRSVK